MRKAFASVTVSHVVALEDRSGRIASIVSSIEEAARTAPRPLALAGVSLGAHAAALWAAYEGHGHVDALGLVMPAWTGEPGIVAHMATATAARVRTAGMSVVLNEIRRESAAAWECDELEIDWPTYGEHLAPALDAAGRSPAPTPADLARITIPCGVVGVREDPLHPHEVAETWAAAIPHAHLETLDRAKPRDDRSVLGAAVVHAWQRAAATTDHRRLPDLGDLRSADEGIEGGSSRIPGR
jgi:pimeloyl-ACP methyl ester carboxylesterase